MLVSGNARILVSENAVRSNIAPLLNKLRKQKPEVFRHSLNVAYLVAEIFLRNYTDDLSLNIESDKFNEIIQGALLHDIGKLQIDDRVLLKQTELTDADREEIKKHTVYGYNMIKDEDCFTDLAKQIVLMHHEKPNGTGYPHGTKNIPSEVKIVTICDKYDALTENRAYRPRKDLYTAFKIIFDEQDKEDLDMLLLLASINEK